MTTVPDRLYTDLAHVWPLLSPPADYAEESATLLALLADGLQPRTPAPTSTPEVARTTPRAPTSLLELGAGAGHLASHAPTDLDHHLVDLAPAMLDLSRALNPTRTHHQADMRHLRLGRSFDAVLLHDAVMYLLSEADLRATYETAFAHLRPGGVFLVVPDVVRETFEETTDGGGGSTPEAAARLLEWRWDPDPTDTTFLTEFAILVREGRAVHAVHETHTMGLFDRRTHVRLLRESGFQLVNPDPLLAIACGELFLARRPTTPATP